MKTYKELSDPPSKDASVAVGRDFLLYWRPDYVDDTRAHFPLLRHAGSNQLQHVSVGDTVWISTVRDGDLFVAGRLEIGECTDWEGAKERLDMDDVWQAKFHVIAAAGTAELMSNLSMAHVVTEIRFAGANDRFVVRDGKIDAGQLQPMRELAPASAALLNSQWTQYRENGNAQKTHHDTGDLQKHTDNNGHLNQGLTAERILESLADELDVVADATRTPWMAYLNKEAYRLLKESDPELFYTNEAHEYLRAWENLTIPFIIHMRVEIDDRIPNNPPDYGCRRQVDSAADPATVPQNIAACLQQVSLRNPRDSQAHYNLGVALTAAGRPQEAIEAYRRALTVYPGMIGAHYNLGTAYLTVGESQLALEQLEETTRLAPEFADAYYEMGRVYQSLGRFEDEFSSYFKAVGIREDYVPALFGLGVAYARLKRGAEARVASKEPPPSLDLKDGETFYFVALAYLALEDVELARNWQRSLREIDQHLADELDPYITEREAGASSETPPAKFELKWLAADQNPFGLRVLDCREFSANTLSTTPDEKTAARFLSLRESTGVEHREHSPEHVVRFQCRLKYAPLERPEEGALFTASQMEDQWDIYFYDGYLYFARSWTGLLVYRAWAVFNAGSLVIDLVEADRDDNPADKTYATRAVDYLIKSHLLKGLVPHPIPGSIESDPEQIALFSFSTFGRWAQYASYEDTLPFQAKEGFSPQGAEVVELEDEASSPNELVLDYGAGSPNELVLDYGASSPNELVLDDEVVHENSLRASPTSVIEVSDSASANSSDSAGTSEELNNPVESVARPDGPESPVTTLETEIPVQEKSDLAKAQEALAKAGRVFVLTGAGVSAESNVPTFRGPAGAPVWRGTPFEELSSAQMVQDNLPLVWEWFDYRRGIVADCDPNAAHLALAACQLSGRFDEFTLVTQNVDGLHTEAGSTGIIELHGNIWRARCLTCEALRDLRNVPAGERPPVCIECGHLMRPDIVLFGESLPASAFEEAQGYAENCDVCLVIGTSALVTPAAELPEAALQAGKFVIEINPEATAFSSSCSVSLRGLAGEILPQLLPSDGRELVLKIGAEGGGMGIYRKRNEEGAWKYSGSGNSMDIDKQEEEQGRIWQYDAGDTLEQAIASLGMSDETLVQLHPIRIHPEYLKAVRDIIDRIAGNASVEFKENDWAQESLARWREMTEPIVPGGEPKGGIYSLSSGRTVSLAELSLSHTYAGLLEGTLDTASRHMRTNLSSRVAEAMPPGAPLVIVDDDPTKALPRFQWIAHFESRKGVKTDDLDYHSRLYVCWFTDDMSDHFNSLIGKVLASIDWDAKSEDYDWTNL